MGDHKKRSGIKGDDYKVRQLRERYLTPGPRYVKEAELSRMWFLKRGFKIKKEEKKDEQDLM